MYGISQKIIDRLNSSQLEDIFVINKLKIQGFRLKGPSNPVKTQRMRRLLINNPNLEKILKKTAEVYKSERNKDYTWALVETLDLDLLKKKIEETNIVEVAFALIVAEKFDLLKDIVDTQINENIGDKEEKIVNPKSNTQSDNIEATVTKLRLIIRDLEEKNKVLEKNLNRVREEFTDLNQENKTLKSKNNKLKDEMFKLNEKYNQIKKSLDLTNEKICKLESNVTTLELEKQETMLEIEKLRKINILFYGINVYRRYIDTKFSKLKNLNYEYINEISRIENFSFYQKLIVLKFTLTTVELEDLLKQHHFKYFEDLHKLVFIESFEELNEYIEKVGIYDE